MFEYQEIVITLVVCFAIIGIILWVKLPLDKNQNETNDELDDKAKVFINEALSLLLKMIVTRDCQSLVGLPHPVAKVHMPLPLTSSVVTR